MSNRGSYDLALKPGGRMKGKDKPKKEEKKPAKGGKKAPPFMKGVTPTSKSGRKVSV